MNEKMNVVKGGHMQNYLKVLPKKLKKGILYSICGIFILNVAAGCGKATETDMSEENVALSEGTEATAESAENPLRNHMTSEEFYDTYMSIKREDVIVSQPGNYIINGVELCDAVEPSADMDDSWEGYSEQDLGLLPPSKMPNVIVDEGGNHGVMYNNEYYIYVNDMNRRDGDKSGFSQYANVWCTPIVSDCKILGGWDEYGRSCAEKGIIVE